MWRRGDQASGLRLERSQASECIQGLRGRRQLLACWAANCLVMRKRVPVCLARQPPNLTGRRLAADAAALPPTPATCGEPTLAASRASARPRLNPLELAGAVPIGELALQSSGSALPPRTLLSHRNQSARKASCSAGESDVGKTPVALETALTAAATCAGWRTGSDAATSAVGALVSERKTALSEGGGVAPSMPPLLMAGIRGASPMP
eukprot:scaffold70110_cov31-Tisochrysis_lutea.AAC.3